MAERTLQRQALPAAVSWDPETRQVVVIGSTDAAQADGVALVHTREAIRWPTRPLPVFVNHDAHPREFVGTVVAMELGREKGANVLVCTVQLADSEAGRLAEPMVASGAARWSIRARIHNLQPGPAGSDHDRATDWEPIELSLVGAGMDSAAVTRSAESINNAPQEAQSMTAENNVAPEATPAPTAAQIRRAREVSRAVDKAANIAPPEVRDEVRRIAETQGLEAARAFAIDARHASEAPTEARAYEPGAEAAASVSRALADRDHGRSVWSRPSYGTRQTDPVADVIQRHWEGKLLNPLPYEFRRLGFSGRTDAEVFRSVLATTDAPLHWEGMGNRQSLAAFAQAPQGIRAAARIEQLEDYRPKSTLDVGLVGIASEVKEGGETTFRAISESGVSYKPSRKALGVGFSPEAQTNDDMAAIPRVTGEMVAAMLESEARELAALFEGHAQGAPAPDGARLFAPAHNNVVSDALSITSIGDAVAKLRTQTSIGGRFVFQTPGVLLCAPSAETTLRQLLSDQINAAEAANVNPWRNLTLEVDPLLSGAYVYLLAEGNRKPLELGRLTPAPVITSEVQFSTGFYRMKCEHSFGCVVVDHRPVVRLNVAAA
ncbi:MAG: hypothetical protein VKM92_01800, partial [Cyanobacteriota bacterium]|nr:hypothetical protein [Cyanobacteriota bacterium]